MLISDLLDDGKTWWESFLKRKDAIHNDVKSLDTLKNIQNFYESFCTSRNVMNQPNGEEKNSCDEKFEQDDQEEHELELHDDSCLLESDVMCMEKNMVLKSNPFVNQLAEMTNSPTKLTALEWQEHISTLNVEEAISDVNKANSKGNLKKKLEKYKDLFHYYRRTVTNKSSVSASR